MCRRCVESYDWSYVCVCDWNHYDLDAVDLYQCFPCDPSLIQPVSVSRPGAEIPRPNVGRTVRDYRSANLIHKGSISSSYSDQSIRSDSMPPLVGSSQSDSERTEYGFSTEPSESDIDVDHVSPCLCDVCVMVTRYLSSLPHPPFSVST